MATPIPVLASNLTVEIYSGAAWVEIGGLDTITTGHSTKWADMSTKSSEDGDGNQVEQNIPARRGRTWTLKGKYLVDPDTGDRDPGQEAFEAASLLTGYDALRNFRFTPSYGDAFTFRGSCELTDGGGEKDEPDAWNGTIYYFDEAVGS